jgi:type IV secretory pathway TraG/TraD family ATPase VirD4
MSSNSLGYALLRQIQTPLNWLLNLLYPWTITAVMAGAAYRVGAYALHWSSGAGAALALVAGVCSYYVAVTINISDAQFRFVIVKYCTTLTNMAILLFVPFYLIYGGVKLLPVLSARYGWGLVPWQVYTMSLATGALTFIFGKYLLWPEAVKTGQERIGTTLLTLKQAQANAAAKIQKGVATLKWLGVRITWKEATEHFLVTGTTGSGKTITICLLLQQVLPFIGKGIEDGHRALIYDPKCDFLPILAGMRSVGVTAPIYTLNPWDVRAPQNNIEAVAWNIANDIPDADTAFEIATILCPIPEASDKKFFDIAARDICYGCILGLMKSRGKDWGFGDIFRAMHTKARIKRMLFLTEEGRNVYETNFGRDERLDDVVSTLGGKMRPYKTIAKRWETGKKRQVSIEEWARSEFILVIAHSYRNEEAIRAINGVLINRAAQILLDKENTETGRTWVVLDELGQLSKINKLRGLATEGRVKGVSLVVGYQSQQGIREIYGEKLASEITGMFGNWAFCRVLDPDDAKFLSEKIGEYEQIVLRNSTGSSSGPSGSGSDMRDAEQLEKRAAVLASRLQNLPRFDDAGLVGFFKTGGASVYQAQFEKEVVLNKLAEKDKSVKGVVKSSEEDEGTQSEAEFTNWTDAEFEAYITANNNATQPPSDSNGHNGVSRSEAKEDRGQQSKETLKNRRKKSLDSSRDLGL